MKDARFSVRTLDNKEARGCDYPLGHAAYCRAANGDVTLRDSG
jgi:hypothetical protein